jgi:hypothetical protein
MTERANIYRSGPLALPSHRRDFSRAEIVVDGLDQAGPSFELRLFVNNPDADEHTPLTKDAGYSGSIFLYGGGGRGDQSIPLERSIDATEAIKRTFARGEPIRVTAVATRESATAESRPIELGLRGVSLRVDPVYD